MPESKEDSVTTKCGACGKAGKLASVGPDGQPMDASNPLSSQLCASCAGARQKAVS